MSYQTIVGLLGYLLKTDPPQKKQPWLSLFLIMMMVVINQFEIDSLIYTIFLQRPSWKVPFYNLLKKFFLISHSCVAVAFALK